MGIVLVGFISVSFHLSGYLSSLMSCLVMRAWYIQIYVVLQAQDFRQQGTKMRRKMWIQNMKMKLIVLGIIIALILIIVLSVCHGFNC
jgi:ABC-type Fe3+ transport system permease subunit